MKSIPLRQWEATAYAAGRLTQLRRVVKPQPEVGRYGNGDIICNVKNQIGGGDYHVWKSKTLGTIPLTTDCMYQLHRTCPYGAPGDRLALREAWRIVSRVGSEYTVLYRGDDSVRDIDVGFEGPTHELDAMIHRDYWNSPVTMPACAVRWHPVITAVRLERVQDMSEADAFRCGIERIEIGPFEIHSVPVHPMTDTYVNSYRKQFTSDNPRTPWDSNPWTWVMEVERVKV